MISFLRGRVFSKGTQGLVLDVNGVGYSVTMSSRALGTIGQVGDEVIVHTYMQVREDGVSLFGFADEEERFLFEKLIGVSGVGPKVAISALSSYSARELMTIISTEDNARMSKVPGVGKKTAQRIIVDLKGSFDALGAAAAESSVPVPTGESSEAVMALLAMGFTTDEANLAIKGYTGTDDVQEIVRYALKRLGNL